MKSFVMRLLFLVFVFLPTMQAGPVESDHFGIPLCGLEEHCVIKKPQSFADSLSENIRYLFFGVDTLGVTEILVNPYVVSSVYYSDAYYLDSLDYLSSDSMGQQIFLTVLDNFSLHVRSTCIATLREYADSVGILDTMPLVAPLDLFSFGRGASHVDAIDLFVKFEGVNVYSMSSGLVVLAESGWSLENPRSTSSHRGGNTVIVFEPFRRRFYRYAHLDEVVVKAGDIIESGTVIGTVGHTGAHASTRGHGKHLHLEIHEYSASGDSMWSLPRLRLRKEIRESQRKTSSVTK